MVDIDARCAEKAIGYFDMGSQGQGRSLGPGIIMSGKALTLLRVERGVTFMSLPEEVTFGLLLANGLYVAARPTVGS